ncbi:hypothetical protein AAK967_07530 [Atopobiaceae bacterium 24-176]
MIDAIIVAAVVLAVVLVVRARLRSQMKGGACAGCGSASVCSGARTGSCPVADDAVGSMEAAAKAAVASVRPAEKGRSRCH